MTNRCVNLAKFSIVLNVLLFFIGGAVLILLGSLIIDNAGGAGKIASATYILLPSVIMLVAGLFMLGLGMVGCFACLKQTQCLNNTFFTMMFIVIVVQVIALGLSIRYRYELQDSVDSYLKNGLNRYEKSPDIRQEIDKIQKQFFCCGVDNYTNWYNTDYFKKNDALPNSCCSNNTCVYTVTPEHEDPTNVFEKGCFSQVKDFFNRYLVFLIVGYIIFVLVQITALVAACVISYRSRRANQNPYSAFGVQA